MSPKSTTHEPLISVVIPAYNRAATIAGALQSIQKQTYQEWEVVVVDDGSSDGSPELLTRLVHEDSRIRMIRHQHNRGAQAARNTGVRAARGEWIAFLDSDDQLLPRSLEARLSLALHEKVYVVHSKCNVLEEDGILKPYGIAPVAGQVYRKLLKDSGPMYQGLLVAKDALKRIGYLDETIVAYQEWDTVIRLAKHHSFAFKDEPTFIYDCRNADTISKDFRRNGRGYEQVFHKHFSAILRYAGPRALARHYQLAASWYERADDRRNLRRCNTMAFLWSCLDARAALGQMRSILRHK